MRKVDFHALSRAAQDHFVDATTAAAPPAPLLVARGGPRVHHVGWVVAAVAAVALVVVVLHGFGDLGSRAFVHGREIAVVEGVLIALVVFGILQGAAGAWAIGALPWRAGVYLFPSALVDARRDVLVVHDGSELQIGGEGSTATVIVAGAKFHFPAEPGAIERARLAVAELEARGPISDPKARASLDPLAEPRISNPLGSNQPRVKVVPAWVKARFLVAIVVGAALGAGLFFVRNRASDDRAFATAQARNDVAGYRDYLARGARHRDLVARTLLPRAELKVAEKAGSVEAIVEYQKAHPQSAIQAEVDAALKAALRAELDAAKKENTLAALRAFAARRPGHGLDEDYRAGVHAVYQAALASFRARANEKDPQVLPFVERLLAWAETNGDPTVEIRMRATPSNSLPRADKAVAKQAMFNGETSYPSRYLDAAKLAAHEDALGRALVDKLGSGFPAEILAPKVGAKITDLEAPLPTPTVPTVFVSHRPEWTGATYPSSKPRGVFVGLNFFFASEFVIPGAPKKHETKATITKNPPADVIQPFGKNPSQTPGEVEAAVYEQMAKLAFEGFATRFANALFKPAK
jgi:hypothetical protein